MNFKIFCGTNNGISNPFSWALPTPGLRNKVGFSGNTINAEGIRGRQELDVFTSADCRAKRTPVPYSADSLRNN